MKFFKLLSITACSLWGTSALAQTAATTDPCPLPQSPVPAVNQQISTILNPFKSAYLNLNRFELDPLSSDIVRIENAVDPLEKRKTFAVDFKIRGSAQKSPFLEATPRLASLDFSWGKDGSLFLQDLWAENAAAKLGLPYDGKYFSLHDIQGMSFEELRTKLGDFKTMSKEESLNAVNTGTLPTGTQALGRNSMDAGVLSAYLKIATQPNAGGIESTLGGLKDKLSTDQKIALVRLIGSQAGDKYDYDRSSGKSGQNAGGQVGLSSQYGAAIPYTAILSNLSKPEYLGICRDIAPAQAQVLSQLGFKNVYVFGYNEGGNHANVIAQDPDHPKQLLQFNYGTLQNSDLKKGMSSLTRTEDYTTVYNIFDHTGKSVANLPSELGALMMEGAGGNIQTLDPMLRRPQGSIASVSLDSKNQKIPVFVGQTTDGTMIAGVGYTMGRGDPSKDILSFTSTSAVVYQKKNTVDYSNATVVMDAAHVMQVASGQVATPWINLNKSNSLQARSTLIVTGQGDVAESGITSKDRNIGYSGSANAELGVEAKYQTDDKKTQVSVKAATQVGLGSQNISDTKLNYLYSNITYVDVKGETVIIPDKLKATLNAAVAMREFGPQIFVQGGVKNPSNTWNADAGYQGSLKKDALTIAPGSERAVFMDVEHAIGKSVVVTVSYVQPTDFSFSSSTAQLGVKGSLSELLKKKRKPAQNNDQ